MHLDASQRSCVLLDEMANGQAAARAWKTSARPMSGAIPFEAFFEAEQDRLLRIMWMVTGNLPEAEDIVQDAFLKVWERWEAVSSMESPVGYLHRAAMNVFRNRYRRAMLAIRKVVAPGPANDVVDAALERVAVRSALRSLTPRQRAALVLTEVLGYSASEAGSFLGIRSSTVRSLTFEGRRVLKGTKELADD